MLYTRDGLYGVTTTSEFAEAVYFIETRQQRINTHSIGLDNVQYLIHSGREGPRCAQRKRGVTEGGISRNTINVTPTTNKNRKLKGT